LEGLPGEFYALIVPCRAVACKHAIPPCGKAVNPRCCAPQYSQYRSMLFAVFVAFPT
jgi:hypothetical protein